jgi:hypothetical protein
MNILETILQSQNGNAVRQLGNQFGLQPDQTQAALAALVPALAAGFQRNMTSQGGLDSLMSALASGQHQRYLDDAGSLTDSSSFQEGNGILAHVFGNKDVSRQVAQNASTQTGIDPSTLKRMLPLVAALAMGGLSRQSNASPGTGAPAGDLMSMLTPVLDQNRDGSMVDDLLGLASRYMGRRPGSA